MARGAGVRMATHGGTHEALLRAAGVEYDIVGPHMSPDRSARFVASAMGLGDVRQSMYDDTELLTYVQAEAAYFREHGTRTVVTGCTLTTLLSTRLAGAALVTEHAGSWVPPAFDHGLAPAPTMRATRHLPAAVGRLLANRVLPRTRFYCGGFNRTAARLGVEGVPSVAALMLGDLTLVPEIPEVLGIPADELAAWTPAGRRHYRPATRLRYSGPLYSHLDVPLPDHVAAFLDRPGPVVYVAITSSSPGLVRRVVRALRPLGVNVLVAGTVHELGDLADERTCVGGILPSHLVMPRVTLAVTAGGQGSMQTAMAMGTPVIGIPLQLEQDLNVALLQRHHAALLVAPRHAGTDRLTRAAARMLAEPRFRTEAQRIRDLYAVVDGPGNAAEAIIDLTERSSTTGIPA
ncbi:glycosyltransferase [Acrocarpospora catenulata]|uniref:glycosyltransferase n=1 Tax=Acrocarpospora catenulata TaxID=2836182 RepID=UPI001BDA7DE1|nr:nucleotide disphospho-sugar-binding domain-containing protein [Acrocarpospora catenulata]